MSAAYRAMMKRATCRNGRLFMPHLDLDSRRALGEHRQNQQESEGMFTIKHEAADGSTNVWSCDSYTRHKDSDGGEKIVGERRQGDPVSVVVMPGENCYIENANGKTIDVVRPR